MRSVAAERLAAKHAMYSDPDKPSVVFAADFDGRLWACLVPRAADPTSRLDEKGGDR